MRAIVITQFGDPDVLQIRDVPTPEPGRGEVRVRVRATAVNRADLLQRMGAYPAPSDCPADIPGLEFSGEVDALGEGVSGVAVGERVLGLVGGGSYAEYIVTHARTLARIPDALSFTDAAALPEAFTTAYDAMVLLGGLSAGQIVLIPAVGSGVGTAAVQIARAIGARSIGTARTKSKLERARALGMDEGIVVEGSAFSSEVLRLTHGRGVDVVVELVGGAYVPEDLTCIATRGRLILVGLMAGTRADVDLGLVLRRRISIVGTALRSRPIEEKIAAGQALANHVMPLVERGMLRPVIDRVMPLDEAAAAHAYTATNASFGKLVLEV